MTEEKEQEQVKLTVGQVLATDVRPEFVSERNGLDYVTGRYVKQALNEIFGWDGWDYKVIDVRPDFDKTACFVHVRLHVNVDGKHVVRDGLAWGYASGRTGNEAFDFACAEAVTDGLKRAAVSLGQALGLCLYPMVGGDKKETKPKKKRTRAKAAAKPKTTKKTEPSEDDFDF